LFAEALPIAKSFDSPRASAFTLLGLDAYCAAIPDDRRARDMRRVLADRLMLCLESVETPEWIWFEEGLAYDNARLPEALIVTGLATRNRGYIDAGLKSLRWLMTQQTSPMGHFRPVGTASFGEHRKPPHAFVFANSWTARREWQKTIGTDPSRCGTRTQETIQRQYISNAQGSGITKIRLKASTRLRQVKSQIPRSSDSELAPP